MSSEDDGKSTLCEIARQNRKSIVSCLIEIQRHQTPQHSARHFLEHLECLRLVADNTLYRHVLDAYEPRNRSYVALSYTWDAWDASPDRESQDPPKTPFLVEQRQTSSHHTRPSSRLRPSVVRATVLERITRYMRAINVDLLWIDRHCIPQDDEKDCQAADCDHESCKSNRDGMQAMDMVYGLSYHPVALLGRPMESPQQLTLLAKLLRGELVSGPHRAPGLSKNTSLAEARLVLQLLDDITSDHWWRRGWPFQENYLGGERMVLLIRHSSTLESQKKAFLDRHGNLLFGHTDGELCLTSTKFHEASTRFCLAIQKRLGPASRPASLKRQQLINRILERAGRYTILLRRSEPMTPIIVRAIENRDITKRWDRLAITSNCCCYSTRLNPLSLAEGGHSLSLAMLTVCLLNGEVLHNGLSLDTEAIRGMTATQYLMKRTFNAIRGPSIGRILTFNKSCRFFEVALAHNGVQTRGHLWKLGKVIDTSRYPSPPSRRRRARAEGTLTLDQRGHLALLASDLRTAGHRPLASEISQYLQDDITLAAETHESMGGGSFVGSYMHLMASEIADAISNGRILRLGYLWDPTIRRQGNYMAVFVWDEDLDPGNNSDGITTSPSSDDAEHERTVNNPAGRPHFAFTASNPGAAGSEEYEIKDLDRHVSFEVTVEVPGSQREVGSRGSIPSLRIRRWLSGLCFFDGHPRVPVVFPWPADLSSISP